MSTIFLQQIISNELLLVVIGFTYSFLELHFVFFKSTI